jgi:hypothetical protein
MPVKVLLTAVLEIRKLRLHLPLRSRLERALVLVSKMWLGMG